MTSRIQQQLLIIQSDAVTKNQKLFVDCLIKNDKGQIFAQKRSGDRRKFRNCWDLPGGGVDDGETIEQAVTRELQEELGFEMEEILGVVGIFEYVLPVEMHSENENPNQKIVKLRITLVQFWKREKL